MEHITRRRETGLSRLQEDMSDLFGRFWSMMPSFGFRAWWPVVDVSETEDEVKLVAELPGMRAGDIDLRVEGRILTISGERKETREEKGQTYTQVERRFGSFRRDVQLPAEVDLEKCDAGFCEGILTITMPKTEKARPSKIKVKEMEPAEAGR